MSRSFTRLSIVLGVLGLLCAVAVPQPSSGTVYFLSTFEGEGQFPPPEVGQYIESAGDVAVQSDQSGNNEVVFDDRSSGGTNPSYLSGTFESGSVVLTGIVRLTYRLRSGAPNTPFMVGVVGDSPTSDFLPSTGPGGNGKLWVNGASTQIQLPTDENVYFTVEIRRTSILENWTYTVSVERQTAPGGGSQAAKALGTVTGSVANSMGVAAAGVKLLKPAGSPGVQTVDSLRVLFVDE